MHTPRSGEGDNGPGPSPGPSSSSQTSPAESTSPEPTTPATIDAARQVFGERLPLAVRYAELLITDGVVRGLLGPREAPRIWDRHLINCAVVSEMIPIGASVVDVGSGAGLPGIVLAVARPDLTITLVEPMARRTAFLSEAVTKLGLDGAVIVVRGRAEDVAGDLPAADLVTARAVAPLDRLAGWCLSLLSIGGRLLALKGASAAEEVAEHHDAVARLGGSSPVVRLCGVGVIDPPTTVVETVRERNVVPPRPKPSGRAARPSRSTGEGGPGRRRSRRN
jgi:16S rRNA (guanine527-N7)-methyltransferase